MAESWPFDNKLDGGEIVGRRVFSGQSNMDKSTIEPDVFEDSRLGDGLSLDRLGQGDVNPSAVKTLTKLSDDEAVKQKTLFHGWAALRATKYKKVVLRPDKLSKSKGDEVDNSYHALLFSKNSIRDNADAHFVSRSLFHDFYFGSGFFVEAVR